MVQGITMTENNTTALEEYYQQQKEKYAERVDTPKPCEVGDTVEVIQIAGVPWDEYYPMTGKVTKVEPRGMKQHTVFADWYIKISFSEEGCNGAVYNGTSELYFVGGTRRDWEEIPVTVVD